MSNDLKFRVAPHVLEDMGINLYSDLPRVLVEYVANAHDADASNVKVSIPFTDISRWRQSIREAHRDELAEAESNGEILTEPLATRTLPQTVQIVIEDDGHGMSVEDLQKKFLVAGRKRRHGLPPGKRARTPNGRPLMGRKGLGKLAGLGVAKHIEVTSRAKGASTATRIVLDYQDLMKHPDLNELPVPTTTLDDGGKLPQDTGGTRIVLTMLMHEPSKSRSTTVAATLAEHFEFVSEEDFKIFLDRKQLTKPAPTLKFAYPQVENGNVNDLVSHTLETDDGPVEFQYRIRFRDEALVAYKRGVRIYTHDRLAAAPSLLATDPNTHGFRQADYLDAIVVADFIDDQPIDYVATDRQSLRWETPMLAPLHKFLSEQMAAACKAYQELRDETAPDIIREDTWTKGLVDSQGLLKRDEKLAYKMAEYISKTFRKGVQDPGYKERLTPMVESIGSGKIMQAISELAEEDHPSITRAMIEIGRLTQDEFDRSVAYARTKVKAITAIEKIIKHRDFREGQNEKEIQRLLEESPWLIDPRFSHMLTGDASFTSTLDLMADELKVGHHAPPNSINLDERPDLVFIKGNLGLGEVVIVELKSSNTPLNHDHLTQLHAYMEDARGWLEDNYNKPIVVKGQLIGTMPKQDSKAKKAKSLRKAIRDRGINADWVVRDYAQLLNDAQDAHNELIRIHSEIEASETDLSAD